MVLANVGQIGGESSEYGKILGCCVSALSEGERSEGSPVPVPWLERQAHRSAWRKLSPTCAGMAQTESDVRRWRTRLASPRGRK